MTKTPEPTVADVMGDAAVVERHAHLAAAAFLMQSARSPALFVVDDETSRRPVAIITARDLVRAVAHGSNAAEEKIATWETPDPVWVPPRTPIREALELMLDGHHLQLPVVDDGHTLVGMIDIFGAARAVLELEGKSNA